VGTPVSAPEHAWHAPSQALLQQTASTQKPDSHPVSAVQAAPEGWRPPEPEDEEPDDDEDEIDVVPLQT
jgi:hypothetical protein